ncbi:MAG: tetratricopeptide repeat protein [Planctomycetota bacterium]|nr:tetratricopeptide repeat protein [Planctomycetota bacterium]
MQWLMKFRMLWVCGVVLGVSVLLGPISSGQDPDGQIESHVQSLWKKYKSAWKESAPLGEGKVPPVDSDTGFWICPDHEKPLEPIRLSGNNRVFVNALVCGVGDHLWVVGSKGPGHPLQWRGPFSMSNSKPDVLSEKKETTKNVPSKQVVLRALYDHFTDSGQQGFYEDRFENLRKWQSPELINHLASIFETEADLQIRMLALEALSELGTRELMPRLRGWIQDPSVPGQYKIQAAVALARLGDRTVIDRVFYQWTTSAKQMIETGDKKGASAFYSQMALIYSQLGEVDSSVTFYLKAIDLDPKSAGTHYNLACAYAKSNRIDEAFDALNKALSSGFKNLEWMLVDGDLRALHDDPRWKEIRQRRQPSGGGGQSIPD